MKIDWVDRLFIGLLIVLIVTLLYSFTDRANAMDIETGFNETIDNIEKYLKLGVGYERDKLSYSFNHDYKYTNSGTHINDIFTVDYKDGVHYFMFVNILNDTVVDVKNMDVGIGAGYYFVKDEYAYYKKYFKGSAALVARQDTVVSSYRLKYGLDLMLFNLSGVSNFIQDEIKYSFDLLIPISDSLSLGLKKSGFSKSGVDSIYNKGYIKFVI